MATSGLDLTGFEQMMQSITLPASSSIGGIDLTPVDWAANYQMPAGIEQPIASPRPSQQQQTGLGAMFPNTLGSIMGQQPITTNTTTTTASGSSPASGSASSSSSGLTLNWLTALFPEIGVFAPTGGDVLLTRIVAILIGLIFIAAGLFLFKETQQIVIKGASRAAEVAASI